jgi:hypothetical protein
VHELQRCPRLEYPDPSQLVSARRGVRQPEPGQRRGMPQCRVISQDRGRARQFTGRRLKPPDPWQDRVNPSPGAVANAPDSNLPTASGLSAPGDTTPPAAICSRRLRQPVVAEGTASPVRHESASATGRPDRRSARYRTKRSDA